MIKLLENFLLYIFEFIWVITGNYGLSLVFMSFVVTVVTYPLYFLADLWKNKELLLQDKMKEEISQIKNAFSGQKQYYMLQACYRMHNYKLWYPVRTSLGLLIQIPFFFAAYNVLSTYVGYSGEAFLFIADLGRPDEILAGINLLPILMTGINLISAVVYSKSLRIKDNLQLFILSLVFFVFLYNSPSALLIYWTTNNIFSLIKSFIKKDKKLFLFPDKNEINLYKEILVIFLIFAIYYFEAYIVDVLYPYRKVFVAINLLCTLLAIIGHVFIKHQSIKKIFEPLFSILIIAICLVVYVFKPKIKFFHFDIICVQMFFAFNLLYIIKLLFGDRLSKYKIFATEFKNRDILLGIVIFCFALTTILPLMYFLQSPEEQGISLLQFIPYCIGAFILMTVISGLLCRVVFNKNKTVISISLIHLSLLLLMNFAFPIDYGVISGFNLTNVEIIDNVSVAIFCKDLFICLIVITGTYLICLKFKNKIINFWIIFFLFFALQIGQNFNNMTRLTKDTANQDKTDLDSGYYDLHKFSKTGINVVYVVADMFNSEYLTQILNEIPDLSEKLDGFTWFKDTLSISGWTETSLGALYGGDQYSPYNNNKNLMNPRTAHQKANQKLKTTIKENGMRPSFVSNISSEADFSPYAYYWASKNDINLAASIGKEKMLAILPFFVLVPNMLKQYIYDNGNWLFYNEDLAFGIHKEVAIKSLSYLELLPEICSVDDRDEGNFLFFRTELPHTPYGITETGQLILNEYPDPINKSFSSGTAAYYSAKKTIQLLIDFLDWLKENKIYNNTQIVICSDHGNNCFDNNLPVENTNESLWKSRANALYLIKRRDERHSLIVDSQTLKSNADIIAQVADDLGWKHEFSYHTNNNRRYYSYMLDLQQLKRMSPKIDYANYVVDGSMFEAASWKSIN